MHGSGSKVENIKKSTKTKVTFLLANSKSDVFGSAIYFNGSEALLFMQRWRCPIQNGTLKDLSAHV